MYAAYLDFYNTSLTDEQMDRVWLWLHDEAHEVEGLVAVSASGDVVGLAHYRPFARPSSASIGGYLDDLFVDPAQRGSGAADTLLTALQILADERGWSVVRWITAEGNYRARAKYDEHALRTSWVTYDMPPRPDMP